MKEIGVSLIIAGFLFLLLRAVYVRAFKVKKAREEIEIIKRRGMLEKPYTEDFAKDVQTEARQENGEEPVTALLFGASAADDYKTTLL